MTKKDEDLDKIKETKRKTTKKTTPAWRAAALELYLEGNRTNQQIAEHPTVMVPVQTLANTISREKWGALRKKYQLDRYGAEERTMEKLWRIKGDETKKAILNLIANGRGATAAFQLYGFKESEQRAWVAEDEEFELRILQAIRQFEFKMQQEIEMRGKDWKSAAWFLEHHDFLGKTYNSKRQEQQEGLKIEIQFTRAPIEDMQEVNVIEHETEKKEIDYVPTERFPNLEKADPKIKPAPTIDETDELKRAEERAEYLRQQILERREQKNDDDSS